MSTKKISGKGRNPNSIKNLKPIRKGEVRNPHGARAHDPVKKALKRLANDEFLDIVNAALTGGVRDLLKIAKDPSSPAIKVGVATALAKAIKNGDWKTLEGIVERLIGKVPVRVDHTTDGEKLPSGQQVILYLPKNGKTKEENEGKK